MIKIIVFFTHSEKRENNQTYQNGFPSVEYAFNTSDYFLGGFRYVYAHIYRLNE